MWTASKPALDRGLYARWRALHNHAMHGEYKMPGGKLIVADVAVANGRLAETRISGDFFIEPDEALDAIDGALANLPADSSEAVLVAAIDGALGPGVQLYGISAQAVAIAVRRALGTPT